MAPMIKGFVSGPRTASFDPGALLDGHSDKGEKGTQFVEFDWNLSSVY